MGKREDGGTDCLFDCGWLDDSLAEKEGRESVRYIVLGDGRVLLRTVSIETSLLENEEDEDGRRAEETDRPPEFHGEEGIRGHKA